MPASVVGIRRRQRTRASHAQQRVLGPRAHAGSPAFAQLRHLLTADIDELEVRLRVVRQRWVALYEHPILDPAVATALHHPLGIVAVVAHPVGQAAAAERGVLALAEQAPGRVVGQRIGGRLEPRIAAGAADRALQVTVPTLIGRDNNNRSELAMTATIEIERIRHCFNSPFISPHVK